MTTDHLTTPQRRILDAIRAAGGPVGIHQVERITGTSKSWTTTTVRRFHQAGLIHIVDWRFTGSGSAAWPRYVFGPGADAPRPKASREELLRRKRERQRKQVAQCREFERQATLPPALPSHTPQIGFWGL